MPVDSDLHSLMNSLPKMTQVMEMPQTRVLISPDELVALRSQGADLGLIESSERIPEFSASAYGFSGGIDSEVVEAVLYSEDGVLSPGENMRFSVGRSTTLKDGNIAGSQGSLPGSGNDVSSMTQREGEYNFYDMNVEWQAASSGPIEFSLTSGITAIEANVSKRVGSGSSAGMHDVTNRVIAVPTIGSSVRWNITSGWSLTGQATTQTLNMGSSLIGFNAQSDWRISDRIGLSAGYQILRSEFDLGAVTTDLNQEGLFARLSIQF